MEASGYWLLAVSPCSVSPVPELVSHFLQHEVGYCYSQAGVSSIQKTRQHMGATFVYRLFSMTVTGL